MPAPAASKAPVVLVVDDEPDLLDGYCGLIEQEMGMPVVGASSGPEALQKLRANRVGLILADYRMPDMDGGVFLAEAGRIAPDVPRVLISAFGDAEEVAGARGLGVPFIAKPVIDLDGFLETLRASLGPPRKS